MILEALSNIKNPNGAESAADNGAIDDFIEQKHEVPANSRRLSSSKLRWLVTQDELKKVDFILHDVSSFKYLNMPVVSLAFTSL
ncbi:hypothetical protein MKW94_018186 [Papaver nudicaule]|uniref:Uncharacterized protein n=1 Tax=Papaver nudicaule TaxID=74823 RepID=A0AA41VYB9_PAPNU|nr:hypothetical protein [Papaver nudicaule]